MAVLPSTYVLLQIVHLTKHCTLRYVDPIWYSDRCPISLAIKVNRKQTPHPQADGGNISAISKRLWNIENEQAFVSRMSSRDVQIRLTHFKTLD